HAGELDPAAPQLDADGLGEADHRVLGPRVGGDPRHPRLAGRRGDVDDVAGVARLHPLDRQLRAGDQPVVVDLALGAGRVVSLLDERCYGHDPGVVDENVDWTELAFGRVEEGDEGRAIGDV